ncbi:MULTISPECIES: PAS domain-containing hybrid sensor histidine kinase/response regulator [Nostocales]|uniref:Circadian input-output histidine kinase CikA n=3 Tax=Nostocales TaxID=1161 RepID=A0A8S9TBB2_9CYAN|nr:PAS domain S-box protein [Tolypothrix bouteillei]KAF3889851.1 PAS domain S-box protein [Tolypothrix bouteillei VB521301]
MTQSKASSREQELLDTILVVQEQAQLLDLALDAIVVRDLDNQITFWNQGAWEIYGWTKEEALGKNSHTLLQTKLPQPIEEIEAELFNTGRWQGELVHTKKDGDSIVTIGRWALKRDRTGQPTAILEINRDITARKRVEEALHQTDERLKLAVKAARIVAWTWNASTNMISRSETACEILGLTPEAQSGTGDEGWKLVHPDDLATHQARVQKAIDCKSSYVSEFRMIRPDNGVTIWLEDRGKVTYNARGNLVSIEGILFDITERKQAEIARQQVEFEKEQLLQRERASRAEAEAANRIKDEFLAILSHELRSPLNAILGWSTMLRTRKLDQATTSRALETIERNARVQTQLIEDLLDVSRILRGKLSLNVLTINPASVVEEAINTMRPAVEAKSIELLLHINPNVGMVLADPNRLQQVVWNLLSNAIKFTPQGGRVEVILSSSRSNSHAQIIVKDTGKGISADFLPHVFEYFRQADASVTRNHGGLGLGLAIVRHLVELHGGNVSAESLGEGQGATFTVRLPLLDTQSVSNRDSDRLENFINLEGIKVLVVDDIADTREFLVFVLQQYGAIAMAAASAKEGFACFEQFKPNILISDIGMPEEDGYNLLRKVRQLPPEMGGQIPAIALTAYVGEGDRNQAIESGYQKHIPKPVDPSELIAIVAELLAVTGKR